MRFYVITVSTKGASGERQDESGPLAKEICILQGLDFAGYEILTDDRPLLSKRMKELCDSGVCDLLLTTGGTGFSESDVTPEATMDVTERIVPGIPEAMRMNSARFTGRAMLSRAAAGIRKKTLIINLPGSPKAVRENLEFLFPSLLHGLEILSGSAAECAKPADAAVSKGRLIAIATSKERGTRKTPRNEAELVAGFGVKDDAHGGNWHRQVSLLSFESFDAFKKAGAPIEYGSFGENLLVSGIDLKTLPVGTRIRIGKAELILTQIGKECHNGCEIYQTMGDCIMPREGVFATVVTGGTIAAGDAVIVEVPT